MSEMPSSVSSSLSAAGWGRRRRRAGRFWVGGLLLVAALLAGWFVVQAVQVRADLVAAGGHAQRLHGALGDGEPAAARAALRALQGSSGSAAETIDGPLWRLASATPLVGDDVEAVRTVSTVLRDLAHDGLPPVVGVADSLGVQAFTPRNGRIPLDALHDLADAVRPASEVMRSGSERMDRIQTAELVGPLRTPVGDLQEKLDDADRLLAATDTALTVLPGMLGDESPREYLVVFQNNAEIRATGGLPGAFAIVSADGGRLSLGTQGAGSATFPEFPAPVLPLTEAELELYTEGLGTYFINTNLTPDFPRTGELAAEMWRRVSGQRVDGVVSVDPVALSYILEGTGSVTLADGSRLTAGNAVERLLHEAYLELADDPAAQDAFFAATAARVFDALSGGQGDPRGVIEGLARAVAEDRILVWSTDPTEQATLATTAVSGALPSGSDVAASGAPHVGVYLNDATGSKMQWFLEYDVETTAASCTAEGVQTLPTTVTLRSTAPEDGAKSLPVSVTGPGHSVAPVGSMLLKMDVFAPAGGAVRDVRFDGEKVGSRIVVHEGRPVMETFVLLGPGQEIEVTMDVISGEDQRGAASVDVTPGAQPGTKSFQVASSCGG